MRSVSAIGLLFAAAIYFAPAARPQTPPSPPPPQPAADTFFVGIEKFERNAARVTRVENDHNRDRRDGNADPSAPRRLSTVYVFGYDRPGLYNPADVEAYSRKLKSPEWTCKVCEHSKPGETTNACTRPLGASGIESVVIDARLAQLTFMHTIGSTARDNHITCRED